MMLPGMAAGWIYDRLAALSFSGLTARRAISTSSVGDDMLPRNIRRNLCREN